MTQSELDQTLVKYHVQPVGNGYIDCICPINNVAEFLNAMSKAGIAVSEFTWWCFAANGHEPCGMGGPSNYYGDGWYSEIEMGRTYEFPSNDKMMDYILNVWPKEQEYRPCFVPAFWLTVPSGWSDTHPTRKWVGAAPS